MAGMGVVLVWKHGIRGQSIPCSREFEEVAEKRSLSGKTHVIAVIPVQRLALHLLMTVDCEMLKCSNERILLLPARGNLCSAIALLLRSSRQRFGTPHHDTHPS